MVSESFGKSVCAVVVTHNRRENLRKTLEALRTFGVDVVVVDNASSDGTAEYLRATLWVQTLPLSENLGGSGGFAAGMRWVCAKGYRWLWVMDDDVVPLPRALEAFARHARPNVCLTPSKLTATGDIFEFEGRLDWRSLQRKKLPHTEAFQSEEAVPCETACFEGMFVDARLAERLIAPWQDFFIGWDDILFGMLAAKAGHNLYLKDFCIQKQFDKVKPLIGRLRYHSSLMGRYFHLRNFCFVIRFVRQKGWGGQYAWFRFVYEWMKACALTLLEGRLSGIRLLCLAWWHGLNGNTTAAKTLPGLFPTQCSKEEK